MKLLVLSFLSSVTLVKVQQWPPSGGTPGRIHGNAINSRLTYLLRANHRNAFPSVSSRQDSPSNTCITPEQQSGTCGPLSLCNQYLSYVNALEHPNVLNFFRSRICRLLETTIYLCCPSSSSDPRQPSGGQLQIPMRSILPSENECGIPSDDRIIGGSEFQVGKWPWLAAVGWPITENDGFLLLCGGTLITRRHILSASHCFVPALPKPTHVRLGEHHLESNTDGALPQDIRIESRRAFGYNSASKENDIEIIILAQDAVFNDFVRPACLPVNPRERDNTYEGDLLTVIGWGKTVFDREQSTSLVPMEVDVPVKPLGPCSNSYRGRAIVNNKNLCAGEEGRDSCSGDSGGPLNYWNEESGRYYVVGIVSHAVNCSLEEFPGVYTRVGVFMDWILNNLQ